VFLCEINAIREKELENRLRSFYMNSKRTSKKKNLPSADAKVNKNDTLDILLIPMFPAQMDCAKNFGKPLDCNQAFAVI